MKPVLIRRRALTLIECVIFVTVWSMVAVGTMRLLGDARMLRGRARDRSVMLLVAQTELERARQMATADLTEGIQERRDDAWPSDVKAVTELRKRPDGTWLIEITVERKSVEGRPQVRLATIRTGGSP